MEEALRKEEHFDFLDILLEARVRSFSTTFFNNTFVPFLQTIFKELENKIRFVVSRTKTSFVYLLNQRVFSSKHVVKFG